MHSGETWMGIGRQAIADQTTGLRPLPWNFSDTVFRCAWEYPVTGFEAEVGFYMDVLGFTTIALDGDYALFTTQDEDLTFACRRHNRVSHDYNGHILCFMTKDIESFAESLSARMPEGAMTRRAGSSVQTVLQFSSPAGLRIDIWEDPA